MLHVAKSYAVHNLLARAYLLNSKLRLGEKVLEPEREPEPEQNTGAERSRTEQNTGAERSRIAMDRALYSDTLVDNPS